MHIKRPSYQCHHSLCFYVEIMLTKHAKKMYLTQRSFEQRFAFAKFFFDVLNWKMAKILYICYSGLDGLWPLLLLNFSRQILKFAIYHNPDNFFVSHHPMQLLLRLECTRCLRNSCLFIITFEIHYNMLYLYYINNNNDRIINGWSWW